MVIQVKYNAWIMYKISRPVLSISLVLLLLLLNFCLACGVQPASDVEGQGLSQMELPPKGNPKLDSQLNQLISAEGRGEVASFAEQSNIELVGGDVRVIIECVPGQIELATEAATKAGARIETSSGDWLQAIVPVTSLTTLANEESIKFIRLPRYPLPAGSQ
jgi:hypothetical protein